ncbi:sortase [Nocardioides sp. TRM66260-LWL]|uniref:sortase domain-containing protein n=1 Tax=Nocardioides sp. TRM66260-LWL TaxID=2874478 RepID=UPI001CC64D0C|nr:sortase [Nocardioides sp. TRM66260-LWL]MBZ5734730.1 sortase [Nocardioides sp. TRM66260-LWL]
MTLLEPAEPDAPVSADEPPRGRPRGNRAASWRGVARQLVRPPVRELTAAEAIRRAALGCLAMLMLATLADATVVGMLRHDRAQAQAFDRLRSDLANGTAPVGQTDVDGRLLDLGAPLSILSIPAIGLKEVVLEGTTSSVLAQGPGHRRDSVLPGQAGVSIIAGRRAGYGADFSRLDELARGDVINVVGSQGVQSFEVVGARRPGDPVPVLKAGASRLTLMTASGPPFLPKDVLRVDAMLTSKVQPAPAPVLSSASLGADEAPMAGQRDIGLPLFLWAQLLLLSLTGVVVLRRLWGRWQTWVVAVPLLGLASLGVGHQFALLLPNLM